MNQARRISRNTGALVLSSGVRTVASFLFVIVSARILGVSGFGSYELAVSYFELFLGLIATGLAILLTREIARDRAHAPETLSAAGGILAVLTIAGAAVLWSLTYAFDYAPETNTAIRWIALALFPAAVCRLAEATLIAFEVAHVVTLGSLLEAALRLGPGLAVLLLGHGVMGLIIVFVVSRFVVLGFYAVALPRFVPDLRWAFEGRRCRRMLREWRTFAAENWLSSLSSNTGVIILSAVHSEFAVGLYFAAVKVSRLAKVVANSYTDAVFPYMARLYDESRDALHRLTMDSVRLMLAIVLPAIVTVLVFADGVIALLYASEYEGSAQILRVVVWAVLFQFLNPFLSHVLFARGEQQRSLHVAAARLVVILIASFALIPPLAGVGAAAAALLGSGSAMVIYLTYALRGRGPTALLSLLMRAAIPALALGLALSAMRDQSPWLLVLVGSFVYVASAVVLQVFQRRDIDLLQSLR